MAVLHVGRNTARHTSPSQHVAHRQPPTAIKEGQLTCLLVHLCIRALERDNAKEHEADEDAELERNPERCPCCVRKRTAHISLLGLSGRLVRDGRGLTMRGYACEQSRELCRVGIIRFAEVHVVGDVP